MKGSAIFILAAVLLLTTQVTAAAMPELFVAIKAGECGTVSFLIHLDHKILEARSVRGIRPLHCAAAEGDVLIVNILIDEGADVNAHCYNGMTPLMIAAKNGQSELLYELDVPYLDINAMDKKGWTALHYAAEFGSCETVEFLLRRGADVHVRTDQGTTPLSLAIVNNYIETAYLIQAHGGLE